MIRQVQGSDPRLEAMVPVIRRGGESRRLITRALPSVDLSLWAWRSSDHRPTRPYRCWNWPVRWATARSLRSQ